MCHSEERSDEESQALARAKSELRFLIPTSRRVGIRNDMAHVLLYTGMF